MANQPTIGIVSTQDSGNEAEAIRQTLEYFGYRTLLFAIGRPDHFVQVLNGQDIPFILDFLVLSVHGDDGRFVMPKLHSSVYGEEEIRNDFGVREVARYADFSPGLGIVNTGCSLGRPEMGKIFVDRGASFYIGAKDDVEGNSALLFVHRFFYELKQNGRTVFDAFVLAREVDEETSLFTLYQTARADRSDQ